MKKLIKRSSLLFLLAILFLLTGCGNSKKDNDFTKDFLTAFENSDLELKIKFVSEGELHLVGANVDSFEQCVGLLKGIGYEFYVDYKMTEESMINMQCWQGKNELYTISVFLMLDMKDNTGASDYIRIYYNQNANAVY